MLLICFLSPFFAIFIIINSLKHSDYGCDTKNIILYPSKENNVWTEHILSIKKNNQY